MRVVKTESPDGCLQAVLSLEELWHGGTVYPSAAVLRIGCRGCAVTAEWPLSLDSGRVCHALEISAIEASRVAAPMGAAVQQCITLRQRGAGGAVRVTLRVSGVSVFMSITGEGFQQRLNAAPPAFSADCRMLSLAGDLPAVAYTGGGALAAAWLADDAYHLVLFKRPGELAQRRYRVSRFTPSLNVESGADACRLLYTGLPFCEHPCGALRCGPGVSPAFKAALEAVCGHYGGRDDDFVVLRGEPGVFAVVARRLESRWIVCGMTHGARTLTLRFEDLWLRLPHALRWLVWKVSLLRDPVPPESGEVVRECFAGLAPDVRIALEMKENGGFVVEFEPERTEAQGG